MQPKVMGWLWTPKSRGLIVLPKLWADCEPPKWAAKRNGLIMNPQSNGLIVNPPKKWADYEPQSSGLIMLPKVVGWLWTPK